MWVFKIRQQQASHLSRHCVFEMVTSRVNERMRLTWFNEFFGVRLVCLLLNSSNFKVTWTRFKQGNDFNLRVSCNVTNDCCLICDQRRDYVKDPHGFLLDSSKLWVGYRGLESHFNFSKTLLSTLLLPSSNIKGPAISSQIQSPFRFRFKKQTREIINNSDEKHETV